MLGAVLLVLTAIATDFTVFTLVSCSRRSGGSTYESVADVAFGRRAKLLCMGLVSSVSVVSSSTSRAYIHIFISTFVVHARDASRPDAPMI